MANNKTISRYGVQWNSEASDIDIEIECIRRDGWWRDKAGKPCGMGKFYHYDRLDKLLWPKFKPHRWHDLVLENLCKSRIVVLLGPKNSCKTNSMARWCLLNWIVWAGQITILVSSTHLQGLKLRVWGEIVKLMKLARNTYPAFPGHYLDAQVMITLEDVAEEDRDLRNGIIAVPCVVNGTYVGLSKYVGIKNERMMLIGDELQFCQPSFVNSISNLDGNPIFQAVVAANPNDPSGPEGLMGEPARKLGGWPGVEHFDKTSVWETNFSRGVCVNLIGTDSPNMDAAETEPIPFPFLITRQKIADTINDFGQDSFEYWSQCVGKMPKAGLMRRVLTHQMCAQFHASEEPLWGSDEFTKILGLDAAYGGVGGDRCILIELWLGKSMDKKPLLWMCGKPMNVPIKFLDERIPEDQIAEFVLSKATERGVETSNIFYDSTGRGSLGSAFARAGSSSVVPIEFGGRASDRMVSSQIKVPGNEYYFNCMSEMWYTWRYAIEADQFRGLHKDVEDEGCLREWKKVAGNKIQVEPKEKTKERAGRSPDLADAVVVGVEGARRRGFVIGALGGGQYGRDAMKWLRELKDDAKQTLSRYSLR